VSDVAVRPYHPDDFGALQRLFRRAFQSELPEELWRWKYERSPFRHLGVVGEKDGLVVAYYGGWVWRIRGAGHVLEALALNDTMTDPAVRMAGRHPILVPLHETVLSLAREQGVGWYGGFPNAHAARFGSRFLGYRYERLLRLQASAESLVAPLSAGLSVKIGQTFGEGHDRLAGRIHALPGFRIERSRDVLNWRFHARPDRYYGVYEVESRVGPEAYAVVSTVGPLALLVDLQAPGESRSPALAVLLSAVAADLVPRGISRLQTAVSKSSPLASRLTDGFGFAADEDENPFGILPTDPGAPPEAEGVTPANFDVRWGDMDVY
jgi:hypothetical protein